MFRNRMDMIFYPRSNQRLILIWYLRISGLRAIKILKAISISTFSLIWLLMWPNCSWSRKSITFSLGFPGISPTSPNIISPAIFFHLLWLDRRFFTNKLLRKKRMWFNSWRNVPISILNGRRRKGRIVRLCWQVKFQRNSKHTRTINKYLRTKSIFLGKRNRNWKNRWILPKIFWSRLNLTVTRLWTTFKNVERSWCNSPKI